MKVLDYKIFIGYIKNNDLPNIIDSMGSIIKYKDKIITLDERKAMIADYICYLNIKNIEVLLPLYKIKEHEGSVDALYVTSVGCSEHIFGFINSYYSVHPQLRFMAYLKSIKLGRIDILKKIKGIELKNFEKLRIYVEQQKGIQQGVKDYVVSEYRKLRAKKDKSPEDDLKKALKQSIKQDVKKLRRSVVINSWLKK
jgi:hypothetical protein